MNERERFLTTMRHQIPDRIPTVIDARLEVQEALKNYYGVTSYQEVLDILGAVDVDRFPTDSWIKVRFPGYDDKAELIEGPWSWLGDGQKYIKIDEKTFKNAWGIIFKIDANGKYVGWVSGPLVDAKNPDEIFIPTIDDIINDPDLPRRVQKLKDKGVFIQGTVTQPYKRAWMLRGMENLLCDYLINRAFVEKLYDKLYKARHILKPFRKTNSVFVNIHSFFKENNLGNFYGTFDNNNQLLSGIIVVYQGDTALCYYGATDYYRKDLPIWHFLYFEIIKIAKEKGFRKFDFGGYNSVVKKSHQVFHINIFKRGFGGNIVYYPQLIHFRLNLFVYIFIIIARPIYLKLKLLLS